VPVARRREAAGVKECLRCGGVTDDAAAACAEDGEPLAASLAGPPVVGDRYVLERRLGSGGMGVVYAARHLGLQKRFALKLLLPPATRDASSAERFRREAEALGALAHPGIVTVTDFGVDARDGGTPYLVMELLAGVTLHARLAEAPEPMAAAAALDLLAGIAAALDHAHARGVLHRDLKPANVVLVREGGGAEVPRLLDFGLAHLTHPARREVAAALAAAADSPAAGDAARLTGAGALLGTVAFMAPELLAGGAATTASDVYAFGVLAYEVLAGVRPFEGEPWEVMRAHRESAPPPASSQRAGLPPELDAALAAALAKDPRQRPATAGALVAELRGAWDAAGAAAWRRRERPRRLALAAAVAALVGAASSWLWSLAPLERAGLAWLDRQVSALPASPPDPALLIVALDEPTAATAAASPGADPAAFGRALDALFAAGARGVAVDLLLPAHWRGSRPLAAALLRHADRVTLGAFSTPQGRVVGPEAVSPLVTGALGAERAAAMFAFLNLEADADGVVRRARRSFADRGGGRRSAFATAALARSGLTAAAGEEGWFWLDRTADPRRLPRCSWRDVATAACAAAVRGRLVLVGGDFADAGEDAHPVTSGGEPLPGLLVHALAASTLRGGERFRDLHPAWRLGATTIAVATLAAVLLLSRRTRPGLALLAGLVVLLFGVSEGLLRSRSLVADAVGPAASVTLGAMLTLALRGAQSATTPLSPSRSWRQRSPRPLEVAS
jgi:serine/threonine-protein kinase